MSRHWSYTTGARSIEADDSFTIGAVLIAASYSLPQIIVGRLVLGLGVGGAAVIAPLYITELAPTAVRGRYVARDDGIEPQLMVRCIGVKYV